MKDKHLWLRILLLFLVEQGIKIYIYISHFEKTIPLLPPMLYFRPTFNRDYSWINSLFQLGISRQIHILLTLLLSIFLLTFYLFLSKKGINDSLLSFMFTFIFAAALCSLVDRVFWNGSLDYIQLRGFFTFDLKDLYVNVFIGTLLYAWVFKHPLIKVLDQSDLFKEYGRFLLKK